MNNKSVLDISSDGAISNVPVPRFTAELKAKWIAALRSGEYAQGKQFLHDASSNTYCCLGVFCEIAGIESLDDNYIGDEGWNKEWIFPRETQRRLGSLNDAGKSFHEIADHIVANIPAEE